MDIRPTAEPDLPEIQAIYAHHVLHGTRTFEEAPPPLEEIAARFRRGSERGFAWRVAADDTGVLGFAYYGPFRDRPAYRFIVEDSIYVREDVRGQGVGKQLVAVIGDAENVGSIGMHASLGFQRTGILRAAGLKFGRWLDVVIMQRALGSGDSSVPG